MGCSSGTRYAVTGIILTQGKDVLYTFDVFAPQRSAGWVKMHTWKGGGYVAYGDTDDVTHGRPTTLDMEEMGSLAWWAAARARARVDCIRHYVRLL